MMDDCLRRKEKLAASTLSTSVSKQITCGSSNQIKKPMGYLLQTKAINQEAGTSKNVHEDNYGCLQCRKLTAENCLLKEKYDSQQEMFNKVQNDIEDIKNMVAARPAIHSFEDSESAMTTYADVLINADSLNGAQNSTTFYKRLKNIVYGYWPQEKLNFVGYKCSTRIKREKYQKIKHSDDKNIAKILLEMQTDKDLKLKNINENPFLMENIKKKISLILRKHRSKSGTGMSSTESEENDTESEDEEESE
ncbi:uncharacterized protein LOC122498295 [Leptopilina heterotoma]|uniref:uncharacterized protein LOC122498295 n=1 Tax=Leptopilina heterotoma TaxID=63436 RepID=UPI001CA9B698|nr:uncharacterized protein LOC122498295 [Leptopilina heterotoma]